MPRRLATLVLCALALLPTAYRRLAARAGPPDACVHEGRGVLPRHWIGCATDPGPRRGLTGRERLALDLPVLLNAASADDLASVPGLSPRLAAAVVEDRERRGPFASLDDLARVRGIGPVRLERARPHLALGP